VLIFSERTPKRVYNLDLNMRTAHAHDSNTFRYCCHSFALISDLHDHRGSLVKRNALAIETAGQSHN
jgi:hypothetical protein